MDDRSNRPGKDDSVNTTKLPQSVTPPRRWIPAWPVVVTKNSFLPTNYSTEGPGWKARITSRKTALPQRDSLYLWSSLVGGMGSGAVASIVCAPLDLVRTRLQVWGEVVGSKRNPILQVFQDIVAKEGWKGCFRGLGASLVTVPAFWGVYFPLYDECKRHCTHYYPHAKPSWIHCGAAVFAGVWSDIICNPMFVVRTRLQTEALHDSNKMGMWQTTKVLYQEAGMRVFWRGMTANLMGLSHVAVQFPCYEWLKHQALLRKQQKYGEGGLTAIDLLLASGLSKMTASVLTYPHEVVRSRMMDARTKPTFFKTIQRIYTREGWGGFYSGLHISLIRVLPNCCITFMTYEFFVRFAKEQIQSRNQRN